MANVVAVQTLVDNIKNAVLKINITGDASGDETAAAVVTPANLTGAPTRVKIDCITAMLGNFDAQLNWDATTDLLCVAMSAGGHTVDFKPFGGLPNNGGAGVTGVINLATTGLAAEKGTIILEMTKVYS